MVIPVYLAEVAPAQVCHCILLSSLFGSCPVDASEEPYMVHLACSCQTLYLLCAPIIWPIAIRANKHDGAHKYEIGSMTCMHWLFELEAVYVVNVQLKFKQENAQ